MKSTVYAIQFRGKNWDAEDGWGDAGVYVEHAKAEANYATQIKVVGLNWDFRLIRRVIIEEVISINKT